MADELRQGRERPRQVADLLASLLPHAPAVSWKRLALGMDLTNFLSLASAVWHSPVDRGGPSGGGHRTVSALLAPLLADPRRRPQLLAAFTSDSKAYGAHAAAQVAAVLATCPLDPAVVRPLLRLLFLLSATGGDVSETAVVLRDLETLLRALGGEVLLCTRLIPHWPAGLAAALAQGALTPQPQPQPLPKSVNGGALRPNVTRSPERRRSPFRKEALAPPRGSWYLWSRELRQSVEARGMRSRLRPRRMEEPAVEPTTRDDAATSTPQRAPLWRRGASVAGTLQGFARVSAVYAGLPEKFEPPAHAADPPVRGQHSDPLRRALASACATRVTAARRVADLLHVLERAAADSIRVPAALQGPVRAVGDAVLHEGEGGRDSGGASRTPSAAPSPLGPALAAVQEAALSDASSTRTSAAAALTAILRLPQLCGPCGRLRAALADGVHRATRGEAPTSALHPSAASQPVHCAVWWTVAALAHPSTPAPAAWVACRAVGAAAAARLATAEECAQPAPLWASQAAALLVQTAEAALPDEGMDSAVTGQEAWRPSDGTYAPPSRASLISIRSGASLRSGIGEAAPHSDRGATLRYTATSWQRPGTAAGGCTSGLESPSALVSAYARQWVALVTLPALRGEGLDQGSDNEQLPPLPAPAALRDAARADPGPSPCAADQWRRLGSCCAKAALDACNGGSASTVGCPSLAGLCGIPAAFEGRAGLRAASSVLAALARSTRASGDASSHGQLDVVAGLWSDALVQHCVGLDSARQGAHPGGESHGRGPAAWRSAAMASLEAAAEVEPLLARALRGDAGRVAAAAAAAWCVRWCAVKRPHAHAEGVAWALDACQRIVRDLESGDPSFMPPTADHVLAVQVAALAMAL